MKFENTEVWGFEHALRGMRNPKNSWARNDSGCGCFERSFMNYVESGPQKCTECPANTQHGICHARGNNRQYIIGPNDLKLCQTLIKSGSEHRKFLRQIFVSVDITAPFYFWKEFDTYKVGTVSNSCSTMHKLATTPITLDCFETDDFDPMDIDLFTPQEIISYCEKLRQKYLETKNKKYWKELIRWLPESWLQKRTITMNYENIYAISKQRAAHKLNEWSGLDNPENPNFIAWARSLPYAKELIFDMLDQTKNEAA